MDGVHDLGGKQGFGPIDAGEPEEPFHQAWEARMLGIVRAMSRPVPWSIDWFRHVREQIAPLDYLTRPYYDQWLQTYAAMMVDSGIATVSELASGKSAKAIPGLKPAMAAAEVAEAKARVVRFNRASNRIPTFGIGDQVRTSRDGKEGHTRLPAYARGRVGTITALNGAHVFPDTNARGDGPAEPLYTVAFAAGELWPEAGDRRDRVYLDLWESYLAPA